MEALPLLAAAALAWLLGGIPFGLVLVRLFRGIDIRTVGSGNVGATNASRAFEGRLRLPVFLLIYVLDFLKGLVPTLWFPEAFGISPSPGSWIPVGLGAAAVAGHCFSPYLRFRGGKGVATATGVFAALDPVALGVALATFLVVFKLTRQVYLGSLALGLSLAATVIAQDPEAALGERRPIAALSLAVAAFLFFTHRSNLTAARAKRAST
jgi:glycerol-3-phosphate acyltransferase PlsY